MTTATIETNERIKELKKGTTVGLAGQWAGDTAIASPLPFGPDEPVTTVFEPEDMSAATATSMPAKQGRDGILARLMGRLLAFSDWVLGPPLSMQDRVNVALIRARDERYWLV